MLETASARATVAALSLAAVLGGCTRTTDLSITKRFTHVTLEAGQVSGTQRVDLAAEAPGAWKLRSHVKSLDLVGLDGTVTRVSSGGNTLVTGSVVLSRTGFKPVTIGTWSEVVPAAAPHSLSATLNPAGEALIEDAIRGDGQLDVTFTAASAGSITFDADVTVNVAVTYTFP